MKISIITPVFNGSKYISQTIDSVLSQCGDFELEYIVIDGKSSDDTLEIVNSYKKHVDNGFYSKHRIATTMFVHSEKDNGMYDALVKGLKLCTGDIVAYINADDFYYPGAFMSAVKLFYDLPEVDVFHGKSVVTNTNSIIINTDNVVLLDNAIENGVLNCGFSSYYIPQEATFWRRKLIDLLDFEKFKNYRLAGDFYLWYTFATKVKFYSADILIGTFRLCEGQLSTDLEGYHNEAREIASLYSFPAQASQTKEAFLETMSLSINEKRQNGLVFYSACEKKYVYTASSSEYQATKTIVTPFATKSSFPSFIPIVTIKKTRKNTAEISRVRFLGIPVLKTVIKEEGVKRYLFGILPF